jgi:hypothetical protein
MTHGMIARSVLSVGRSTPADPGLMHFPQPESAILSAEMRRGENSPFNTATLTCTMQCAVVSR